MVKERLQYLERIISTYKTVSSSEVDIVSGNFIKIGSANYTLVNGETIKREEIVKNNGMSSASIILPVTVNNEVLLVVQPRVLTRLGVGIELPAGYIDKGETAYEAALRELEEETGYIPENMVKVAEYYQDQGCSRAFNECFVGTGCRKMGKQKLDRDEFIQEFLCTYPELLELIEMSYICDAGSIITVEKSKELIKHL